MLVPPASVLSISIFVPILCLTKVYVEYRTGPRKIFGYRTRFFRAFADMGILVPCFLRVYADPSISCLTMLIALTFSISTWIVLVVVELLLILTMGHIENFLLKMDFEGDGKVLWRDIPRFIKLTLMASLRLNALVKRTPFHTHKSSKAVSLKKAENEAPRASLPSNGNARRISVGFELPEPLSPPKTITGGNNIVMLSKGSNDLSGRENIRRVVKDGAVNSLVILILLAVIGIQAVCIYFLFDPRYPCMQNFIPLYMVVGSLLPIHWYLLYQAAKFRDLINNFDLASSAYDLLWYLVQASACLVLILMERSDDDIFASMAWGLIGFSFTPFVCFVTIRMLPERTKDQKELVDIFEDNPAVLELVENVDDTEICLLLIKNHSLLPHVRKSLPKELLSILQSSIKIYKVFSALHVPFALNLNEHVVQTDLPAQLSNEDLQMIRDSLESLQAFSRSKHFETLRANLAKVILDRTCSEKFLLHEVLPSLIAMNQESIMQFKTSLLPQFLRLLNQNDISLLKDLLLL